MHDATELAAVYHCRTTPDMKSWYPRLNRSPWWQLHGGVRQSGPLGVPSVDYPLAVELVGCGSRVSLVIFQHVMSATTLFLETSCV
jgi:hypothetical protein